MDPDQVLLEIERHNLAVAGQSLLILLALLALHFLIFIRPSPANPLLRLWQARLRYLTLFFVFLSPLYWAASQLPDVAPVLDELHVSLLFFALLTGLESLYSLTCFHATGAPRFSQGFHLGLTAFLYGVPALIFVALLFGFPIFDPAILYAFGSIFIVYLCLHLIYALLFKWIQWAHPLAKAISSRLRFYAYLTVLGLVVYFAVTRYTFIPVTGTMVDNLATALISLAVIMACESFLAAIFDFYFPVAKGSDVPTFFRDLTRALVYIGLLAFFVGFVLKRDLNSLLVGSAVITVSIGFALQETLGNFFAGLALRLSEPYTLGDFVDVGGVSGKVAKIDWRATSLLTYHGDYVVLPNSFLAKELISNHSVPTRFHARNIDVRCHYRHPPNQVKAVILEAAYSVPDLCEDPMPELYIIGFDDSSIGYRLRYWIADWSDRFRMDTNVRTAIWYHFKREGIEIPFPIRTLVREPVDDPSKALDEVRGFLETVDFLNALDKEDLDVLARRARYQLFAAGEKVCVQGEPGDSFYIIKNGKVEVTATDARGEVFLSAEMNPGNYFGEMALLTGEPRSATVAAMVDSELLRLGKEDLRTIIKENPEVEKVISNILAQRQLRTAKAREEAEEERLARAYSSTGRDSGPRLEQLSEQFLKKIREFFSY